jgi:hypothetical protein
VSAAEAERNRVFADLDASDYNDELTYLLDLIGRYAATHPGDFTANDIRPHIAQGVNTARIGRAFYRAIELGIVVPVALDRSDKRNTHRARINRYRGRRAA